MVLRYVLYQRMVRANGTLSKLMECFVCLRYNEGGRQRYAAQASREEEWVRTAMTRAAVAAEGQAAKRAARDKGTYYSLLTAYYLLLTTYDSLLTAYYLLFTTCCSLLTAHHSLLTTHYSLLTTHYLRLTTYYLLLYYLLLTYYFVTRSAPKSGRKEEN